MTNDKSKKIILLEKLLRGMSALVLKKYNPKIISITGSVGKTSAKEAIYAVMSSKFRTRKTEKNYNNEIGLPLTIIGAESGEGSMAGWMAVFLKWVWVMIFPIEYPEVLVLEMGADRPGDISYLTGFIKSEVGVITDISYSHIEYFKNVEGVAKEKSVLVKRLAEKGLAVINADNPHVAKLKDQLKCNVIAYGFSETAEMRATGIGFGYNEEEGQLKGLSFKLNYRGTTLPVRMNNVLAKHQIYSALAAVAAGTRFGINLVEASAALENFTLPLGRMNLVPGIRNSYIIDDTYNSSPVSAAAALNTLDEISSAGNKIRKIAILGDMLELGSEEIGKHKEIGKKVFEAGCDFFLAVGERMKLAGEQAIAAGMAKEKVFYFENPMGAGKKAKDIIREDDLILVKGSQGMRMEKVVETIMLEPERAEKLLCRQNRQWKERAWKKV